MNQQPPEYVSQLFAIGFVLMVVFYTIKAFIQNKPIRFEDKIIIGYIDDPAPIHHCTIKIEQPKAPKQKKKTTTTSTSTTPNPPPPPDDDRPESPKPFTPPKQLKQHDNLDNDQLFIDCVDALRSLGLKKLASKQRAKEIFSSPNRPSNIQEFLLIAFKN